MTRTISIVAVALAALILTASAIPAFSGQQKMDERDRLFLEKFRMTRPEVVRGQNELKKKQMDTAEQTFIRALKQMPDNALASFFLAETYYEKGEFDKGLDQIAAAEKNYSLIEKIIFRQQMNAINQATDDRAAASDNLQALRQQLGSSVLTAGTSSSQLGAAQSQSGVKAGEQDQKTETFSVPAEYFYVHGNLLFRLKRYEEALAQYEKTIQTDPRHGKAYNNIANIYYMAKQYDKSLEYIEKAEAAGVKVNPEFRKAVLKALGR
jgi:tetratricopeptide (TPR) repeat protein